MEILAATDLSTRSYRALRRAGLLAAANDARLTLLHVVDDDQPSDLMAMETREVGRILEELIGAVAELRGVRCRAVVIAGDAFDGILRTSEETKADLVVMGAHRKQLLRDVFIGTTIERVIRAGSHPVLMVNNEVSGPYRAALVATDLSESSAHAIGITRRLKLVGDAQMTFLHAYLPLAKGKMSLAGLPKERIDEYLDAEHLRSAGELSAFLQANGLDLGGPPPRVEEGGPLAVIARVVERTRPDLLVMGTHGRSGIVKALLGSVTEGALRSLDLDILAVPPAR